MKQLSTGKYFAAKIFKTRNEEIILNLKKEFQKLKTLKHPNIIKFHDLLIDIEIGKVYFIMEYIEGKELTYFKSNSEKEKKNLFKQLITGVLYLHSNGVIHRDLKPENILIQKSSENIYNLKIIDFNVAKIFEFFSHYDYLSKKNYSMGSITGTIEFSAPEIFNNSLYTEMVDVWSLGCVLVFLITGQKPFSSTTVKDFIFNISNHSFNFKDFNHSFSLNVKDLIKKMLVIKDKQRILLTDILFHPWFYNETEENNIRKRIGSQSNTLKITNLKNNKSVF